MLCHTLALSACSAAYRESAADPLPAPASIYMPVLRRSTGIESTACFDLFRYPRRSPKSENSGEKAWRLYPPLDTPTQQRDAPDYQRHRGGCLLPIYWDQKTISLYESCPVLSRYRAQPASSSHVRARELSQATGYRARYRRFERGGPSSDLDVDSIGLSELPLGCLLSMSCRALLLVRNVELSLYTFLAGTTLFQVMDESWSMVSMISSPSPIAS